ncbi:MAG TPA: hypothetical protein VF796_13635 [Humisphaera sp.]
MIFQHTIDLVLSRRKTLTTRLMNPGDALRLRTVEGTLERQLAVLSAADRPRWILDHTYAVQAARGAPAAGRIRVVSLAAVDVPKDLDDAYARAEGFDDVAGFLAVWRELHGRRARKAWAIGFELVEVSPAAAAEARRAG